MSTPESCLPDALEANLPTLALATPVPCAIAASRWVCHQRGLLLGYPDAPAWPSETDFGHHWAQAVVTVNHQRQASLRDAVRAWNAVAPGGRLVVYGANRDGVKTTVRQIGRLVGSDGDLREARGHGRVVVWTRTATAPLAIPPWELWQLPGYGDLRAPPGVFAAGRVDRGSAVLLQMLAQWSASPRQVVDMGCGCGVLLLVAGRRWPQAQLTGLDADARAVAATAENALQWGLGERCHSYWWDSHESAPVAQADLVLCNPPWHQGGAIAREPAEAMLQTAVHTLAPGGTLLVVATRTQPFEGLLHGAGELRQVFSDDGFKVMALTRAA